MLAPRTPVACRAGSEPRRATASSARTRSKETPMISFDDRHGPADAAPATAYPDLSVPDWYRDAKLGIFVHWGLYSVPAWADVLDRSDVSAENAYARHQYAEWYANTVRIEGSRSEERRVGKRRRGRGVTEQYRMQEKR